MWVFGQELNETKGTVQTVPLVYVLLLMLFTFIIGRRARKFNLKNENNPPAPLVLPHILHTYRSSYEIGHYYYVRMHCRRFVTRLTDLLISKSIPSSVEETKKEKSLNVAKMVSHSLLVMGALEGKTNPTEVQAFANQIKDITIVNFVVVMDMKGIRLSHPELGEVGRHFRGGDEGSRETELDRKLDLVPKASGSIRM